MNNPCLKCKMSDAEKAACCGCPERLEYEKHKTEPHKGETQDAITIHMIYPENDLDRSAQAIASCMPCRLCPNPCKAKENSSMANCVIQWRKTITEAVEKSKDNL